MKILLQRVHSASVDIDNERVAEIGAGLLLLVGFGKADADNWQTKIGYASQQLANLRIFANDQGKLDHSVTSIHGDILAVPQFTLYGKCTKGRRPNFTDALTPSIASLAFDAFQAALEVAVSKPVPAGVFGAHMQVNLVNDGPLTLAFEY